jgi:hypothetical protein
MPHGAPDWNIYRPYAVSYSVADLAEHAARTGGIVTFDRRGDTYFLWDFSTGWGPWENGHSGALGAQLLVPYPHAKGAYSVQLTAGNDANHDAYIELITPMLTSPSFGVSLQFSVNDVTDNLLVRLTADSGIRLYDPQVRYVFATQRLEIYHQPAVGPPAWYTIPNLVSVQSNPRIFSYLKFVIDVQNRRYDRILFDDLELSLKAYALVDIGAGGWMTNTVNIRNIGIVDQNDIVYIDNVILTHDEL